MTAADMASDEKTAARKYVVGWLLDGSHRAQLLKMFPPVYPDVIADHVTLSSGTESRPPPADTHAEVVGQVNDGAGVQTLIVSINGTTHRPDGSTYHLTWSIDRSKGRKARDSNDVIRRLLWKPLERPIVVALKGAELPGEP